jgi:hypothetical protein
MWLLKHSFSTYSAPKLPRKTTAKQLTLPRRSGEIIVRQADRDCSREPTQLSASCGLSPVETYAPRFWLSGLIFFVTLASSSQATPSTTEINPPDLNLILQYVERSQHREPSQSRPYELSRRYRVFHGTDKQPISEVTAQINFVPPATTTYKIIQARGNSWGQKSVRALLEWEIESANKGRSDRISRMNYDFVFLRRVNSGKLAEYVLEIVPKRKDKSLLHGQIWVNASTFCIRQIEGVPAKSPSVWLKNIHITLQFAELGGVWVPITFDAIATVRLFGEYTLTGVNIRSSESSTVLK